VASSPDRLLAPRDALGIVGAVLVRPRLWGVALRQIGRMRRPAWWRRPPFLPVPDRDYLRFRLVTQYGSDAPAEPGDVVTYLDWCRGHGR
jgi:hypothetical protein